MSDATPDLILKPGGIDHEGSIRLEIHPDLYDEVIKVLKESDVEHDEILEHSLTAGVVFSIVMVYGFFKANGAGQLAQLIEAIAHRNDGKSLRIKMGDIEIDRVGESLATMQEEIDKQLPIPAEQSREMKRAYEDSGRRNAIADGELEQDDGESSSDSVPDESSDQSL